MTARAPLKPAEAGRRHLVLTALRWLPVGISIPVTVLLALSRGLSLANVGLADVVGRRPLLVASGVLHLLSRLASGPLALGLPRDLLGSLERRAPQPVANVDPPLTDGLWTTCRSTRPGPTLGAWRLRRTSRAGSAPSSAGWRSCARSRG